MEIEQWHGARSKRATSLVQISAQVLCQEMKLELSPKWREGVVIWAPDNEVLGKEKKWIFQSGLGKGWRENVDNWVLKDLGEDG